MDDFLIYFLFRDSENDLLIFDASYSSCFEGGSQQFPVTQKTSLIDDSFSVDATVMAPNKYRNLAIICQNS